MWSVTLDKEKFKRWIKFITTIKDLTEEICFWITEEEIRFRDMDAARISMIDFSLENTYFLEYNYDGEEELPICIQSKKLLEFSKLMKNAEEVTIMIDEGLTHFILRTNTPYEKQLSIPIMVDKERTKPGIPDINYTARVKLVSTTLKDALMEAKAISDRITFMAEGNNITFISKNDEGFQIKNKLTYPENLEILDINVEERSVAVYMVKPLLSVIKELSSISRISELLFGNALPLDLKFELIDGENYQYFLAPRTEE